MASVASKAISQARGAWGRRASTRAWLASGADARNGEHRGIVYFGSSAQYLYQLRDWLPTLTRLHAEVPLVVMVRDPNVALELQPQCPIPIVLAKWIADMDRVMARNPVGLVLYVNQNISNFDVLAYAAPSHLFLSHGESDKVYTVSNQAKAYDATLVAGQAAVDRYRKALHHFDADAKLRVVGRPQLEIHGLSPSDLPDTDRPTVIYAPTTEGSGPPMEYGSLASHGPAIVEALLAGGHRVIFRPHPQAGRRMASHAKAVRTIIDMLRADANGDHFVDRTPRFDWQRQLDAALIADISAVAVDWLATGKPLVMTKPVQPAVQILGDFPDADDLLAVGDDVLAALHRAESPAASAAREVAAGYYFAHRGPGESVDAFVRTCLEFAGDAAARPGPE